VGHADQQNRLDFIERLSIDAGDLWKKWLVHNTAAYQRTRKGRDLWCSQLQRRYRTGSSRVYRGDRESPFQSRAW